MLLICFLNILKWCLKFFISIHNLFFVWAKYIFDELNLKMTLISRNNFTWEFWSLFGFSEFSFAIWKFYNFNQNLSSAKS